MFTAPLRDAVTDRRRAVDAVALTTLLVATFDLVVPAVVLAGYLVRLLREDDGLPPADDAVSLLWTGVRAAALVTLPFVPVVAARFAAAAIAPSGSVEWLLADILAGRLPPGSWFLRSAAAVAVFGVGALFAPLSGYVAAVLVGRFAATDFRTSLAAAPVRRALTDRRNVRAAAAAFAPLVCGGFGAAVLGFLPFGPVSRLLAAVSVALGTLAAAALWRAHAVPLSPNEAEATDDASPADRPSTGRDAAPTP